MPVAWKPKSVKVKVQDVLDEHDATSDRCETAAKEIFDLACERHAVGFGLLLPVPEAGPVVSHRKKVRIAAHTVDKEKRYYWYHHVCVTLQDHCVCALTTAEGHPRLTYLDTYFEYPEYTHFEDIATPDELDERLVEVR